VLDRRHRADGDHVTVDPTCAWAAGLRERVPLGAMTTSIRAPGLGRAAERVLPSTQAAARRLPALHNAGESRALLARAARRGRGLPARVIPLEVHHPASIGIDVLLGALLTCKPGAVLAAPK